MSYNRYSKDMQVETALEELEFMVGEISNIDDFEDYIANNKEEFVYKWAKINQYYKYVIYNTDLVSDEGFMAIAIISDLAALKPSLGKWVDLMIEPKKNRKQIKLCNYETVDFEGISTFVQSIEEEVRGIVQWEDDHIIDVQNQLEQCQRTVMNNKSYFDINSYQDIMDSISYSLERINRFNRMASARTRRLLR